MKGIRYLMAASLVAFATVVTAPLLAVHGAAAAQPSRSASDSTTSELSALKSMKWATNVKVSIGRGSWTFRSTGVPGSKFTASDYAVPSNPLDVSASGAMVIPTARILRNQHFVFQIPLVPKYSTTTTTNLGAIGVLLDGAVLYNPYEANDSTVATAHNFKATQNGVTASFLDSCDGHPGPGGQYHYHGMPACLVEFATTGKVTQVHAVTSFRNATTAAVAETNAAARRPVLLGFAFDGYGIYDNIAMDGASIPVSALDKCNGLFSPVPGYPHGIYHYVLENVKTKRSSLSCYHGVVSSAYTKALAESIDALLPSADVDSPLRLVAPTTLATATSLAANPLVLEQLTARFVELSRVSDCG